MKARVFLAAAALMVAATSAFALSEEHAAFLGGPAQHLMTKEEAAAAKAVRTDEEAKAFIDLFWARRDPSPGTPQNEARELFAAKVDWADKNLAERKKRGSMTDRGKVFILYGPPKRVERTGDGAPALDTGIEGSQRGEEPAIQWVYEGDEAKAAFNATRATIRFVDRTRNGEYRVERGSVDLNAAQQRAVQKLVINPNAQVLPAAAAAPRAVAPVAPVAANQLTTAALATAVAEVKAAGKNPYENKAFLIWGEYVTADGEYFVPVLLYLPKGTGLVSEQDVTFFGLVEDESGTSVLAFEQPLKLHAANDDVYVDRSLALPAGKYRGFFGVAREGKPVAVASTDMTLAGTLDKDASAVSQLILSTLVQPMPVAQRPTEPYAFGGVKVVPKADRVFRTTDELWYFFEMRHPGLGEAATPAEQKPKVQVKVEVEGKGPDGKPVKRTAPPREVEPVPMKGVAGHYGVGNAIPLESFQPGDYTITLKVMDTVKKVSYTLSEPFRIVQ